MKLDNQYWLYVMECLPSGRLYIGQTGKPNPCWRWSEHYLELKNGKSPSPKLQKEWTLHSDLKFWRFRALERATGKRMANFREAELVLAIPERNRLNCLSASCVSMERRRVVEALLKEGATYAEIKKAAKISLGMISKIHKQIYGTNRYHRK